MIIHNMKQQTKEWFDIKKLHFSASHASTILAMGKGLESLIDEMLADYYSTGNFEDYSNKYRNAQIDRGNEYEERARSIYELETGSKVQQVGFVEMNDRVGVSPDGLIDEDGLIEIKNHNDLVFLRLLQTGKIDKKYLDQMQMQMYVTERSWCDYFGFNPNFPQFNCYFKKRIYRDLDTMGRLNEALKYAVSKLEDKKAILDKLLVA